MFWFSPPALPYYGATAASTIRSTVGGRLRFLNPWSATPVVRLNGAIANGDVTYVIGTSDNLGAWTPQVTHTPPKASPTISFTLPTGLPREFARLKVTIQ